MIALYDCTRLSARITAETCKSNQRAGRIFACEGCDGVEVIPVEEAAMSKGKICKHPGCNKYVSKAGYCWGHCKQNGINPKTGNPLPPDTPRKDEEPVAVVKAAPLPVAAPAEVAMSDMGAEIDALFQAKRAEWLDDLQGATSLRSRAKHFLAMCEAIEGLGY